MLTRKQYLGTNGLSRQESNALHNEFYLQFSTEHTKIVARQIALDIMKTHKRIDSALNGYKNLGHWDMLAYQIPIPLDIYNSAYEKSDRSVWISDKLCILKCAVREAMLGMGYVETWEMSSSNYLSAFLTCEVA